MTRVLLLCGFVWMAALASCSSAAEPPPARRAAPRFVWRSLSQAATKLPSDRITCLAKGRGSDLWVGTSDAGVLLVRDSSVQQLPAMEPGSLPPPVTAVVPGLDGEGVWVGTAGRGLAHWTGETWETRTAADGLPSNMITGLAGKDSRLWIGTDAGLVEWSTDQVPGSSWSAREGLPADAVTALALRQEGAGVWVGTRQGLSWLDGRDAPQRLPPEGSTWLTALLAIPVLAFYERPVLVTGGPAGLAVRDAEAPETVLARLGAGEGLPDGRVTALAAARGRERSFWAGTDGGGLVHLEARKDAADRPFIEVHPLPPGADSYPDGQVSALACDENQIWVASSRGGLSVGKRILDPSRVSVETDWTTSTAATAATTASTASTGDSTGASVSSTSSSAPCTCPNGPSSEPCTPAQRLSMHIEYMGAGWTPTAFAAVSRSVWVGFADRGVAEVGPPQCDWRFYPRVSDGYGGSRVCEIPVTSAVLREERYGDLVSGVQIYDMVVDNQGILWFATADLGLSRRERGGFVAEGKEQGAPARRVKRLHADRGTGDLYAIAENTAGFFYDDPENPSGKIVPLDLVMQRRGKEWRVLPLAPRETVRTLRLHAVKPMARDGKLYLGTSRGLMEYDGLHLKPVLLQAATIDLTTGKPAPMDERSRAEVSAAAVYELFEGPPGILWLASEKGLWRDDGRFAIRVPGTEGQTTWEGHYDADCRAVYFLTAPAPEWRRDVVSLRKGNLYRYDLARRRLRFVADKVTRFLVTPTALWFSRPPCAGMIQPKPMR